jgi:hypothetical protein
VRRVNPKVWTQTWFKGKLGNNLEISSLPEVYCNISRKAITFDQLKGLKTGDLQVGIPSALSDFQMSFPTG